MENGNMHLNDTARKPAYDPAGVSAKTYGGSVQQLLRCNIGRFAAMYPTDPCRAEPLSGIIECVTGRYVVLKDPISSCRLVGDAWNAACITFPCNET